MIYGGKNRIRCQWMFDNEILYKFTTPDTRVKMCPTLFCCCKCGIDIKLNRCAEPPEVCESKASKEQN